MSVGDRIRSRRIELKISQSELAKLIRVSKQTLYKYETGIITNIPSDKIEAIGRVMNCAPGYFMGWTDITGQTLSSYSAIIDALAGSSDSEIAEITDLINNYRILSERGRAAVRNTLYFELGQKKSDTLKNIAT